MLIHCIRYSTSCRDKHNWNVTDETQWTPPMFIAANILAILATAKKIEVDKVLLDILNIEPFLFETYQPFES